MKMMHTFIFMKDISYIYQLIVRTCVIALFYLFSISPISALADTYNGSVFIDATGGSCALVGDWDVTSKTCTLTKDIEGSVTINANDVTLDGDGHSIQKTSAVPSTDRIGVLVNGVSRVTIKNIAITWYQFGIVFQYNSADSRVENSTISYAGSGGIYVLSPSTRNTFINNTITHSYFGIRVNTGSNDIENNTITNNLVNGIWLYYAPGNTVKNNTTANNLYGVALDGSSANTITDNTIQNNTSYGLRGDPFDENYIFHNNFIDNGDGQVNLLRYMASQTPPIGGNYWSDFDKADEGCTDDNRDGMCDQPRYFYPDAPYADLYPWTHMNGWIATVIPSEYLAPIVNTQSGTTNFYNSPDITATVVKTLPNDWVVKVFSDTATGDDWVEVEDETDGSKGWIQGAAGLLSYDEEKQEAYAQKSETQLTTKEERADIIKEAVHHYFTDSNTTHSLYSGRDTANIPLLTQGGFPEDLALAIAAQESGGPYNFNNELVSYDYGHGAMQVTFQAWANEPDTFKNNKWDNRGKYSKVRTLICRNIIENELGIRVDGTDEYKKCYKNTATQNTLSKPYDHYDHADSNPLYKQYTNTVQSIYANVKDGLGNLQQDKYHAKCPGADTVISGLTFTCHDIEKILAVWGYNGLTLSPNSNYLRAVATHLASLSTDFPGTSYDDTDQLVEKLKVANDNRKSVRVYSPVELSVVDEHGNITGLQSGVVTEQIPNSSYFSSDETATLFFPQGGESYRVVGTDDGTYGITIESVENGETARFDGTTLPISSGEIHHYAIDQEALARGEKGVTVEIDTDGDGNTDRIVHTGATLDDLTPPVITATDPGPQYYLNEKTSFAFSANDNKDGMIQPTTTLNGTSIESGEVINLTKPGTNVLEITAVDTTGNESKKTFTFNVLYRFGGFLAPIKEGAYYKTNMTLPVKFILEDANSNKVFSSVAKIYMQQDTRSPLFVGEAKNDPQQSQYIGSVSTSNLVPGEWHLQVHLDDGTIQDVVINLK